MKYYMILELMGIMIKNQKQIHFKLMIIMVISHMHQHFLNYYFKHFLIIIIIMI
jgi:hypothetical protein